MASSIKHTGADSILYSVTKGTLVNSGALTADTWYKIYSKVTSPTSAELPDLVVGSVFKSPKNTDKEITLATGESVYPLTLTEVCKVDIEMSGEMGVVDTTDSCDYPYTTNLPDGYTSLSGSINTMVRFDEDTDEIIDVTKDFLVKFFDILEDDGEGKYTLDSKDDSDLLLFILMNKDSDAVTGKVTNWIILPAILNSIANNFALKDAQKADYSWTKGQGPAQIYQRTEVAASA